MESADAETDPATQLGDFLAWDGDGSLVVTDTSHPMLNKTRRPRLSPSTANSIAHGCHARWAVERMLPRTDDPFGPAEQGSAGHAVLEEMFNLPPERRDQATAMDLLNQIETLHPELAAPTGPMDLTRWRGEVAAKISGLWNILEPKNIRVLATERHLDTVSIDGVPVNGYIDLLTQDDDGIGIMDYKTGRVPRTYKTVTIPDDNANQQRIYALALKEADGQLPTRATLAYTAHSVAKPVDLSRQALDETRAMFTGAWTDLATIGDTGRFATTKSGLCPWCPLATVCPTANADKAVKPKSDAAAAGPKARIPTLGATRRTTESTTPNQGAAMTYIEGKAWEETLPAGNTVMGHTLNWNSYAATGVCGLTSEAVRRLAGQDQVKVTASTIAAVTGTLTHVVLTAQHELTGRTNMQDGLNTRLRGFLLTVLDIQPMPFGGTEADWSTWATKATSRLGAMAAAAGDAWEAGLTGQPWAALCSRDVQVPRAA